MHWVCALVVCLTATMIVIAADAPAEQSLWSHDTTRAARLVSIEADKFAFEIAGKQEPLTPEDFHRFGGWRDISRGPHVLLVDGSILVGDVLKIDDEQLHLGDAAGLGRCRFDGAAIPLSAVRGVMFQPPAETLVRDRLALKLQTESAKQDIVSLIGGETLAGLLLGSKKAIAGGENSGPLPLVFQLDGAARPMEILPGRIKSLALNAALLQPTKDLPRYWLGLRDGNWLAVAELAADAREVQIKLGCGVELKTPLVTDDELAPRFWQGISYLEPTATKLTYLSDLKPAAYESKPFLSLTWPMERDRSVVGGRLRSSTGIARKGLGLHASCTVDFAIPAGSEAFAAEVAIDQAANPRGSAIGLVLVRNNLEEAWREVAKTAVLRRGDPPASIRVRLDKATFLRLECLTADDGDSGDYVNWLDARFQSKAN